MIGKPFKLSHELFLHVPRNNGDDSIVLKSFKSSNQQYLEQVFTSHDCEVKIASKLFIYKIVDVSISWIF